RRRDAAGLPDEPIHAGAGRDRDGGPGPRGRQRRRRDRERRAHREGGRLLRRGAAGRAAPAAAPAGPAPASPAQRRRARAARALRGAGCNRAGLELARFGTALALLLARGPNDVAVHLGRPARAGAMRPRGAMDPVAAVSAGVLVTRLDVRGRAIAPRGRLL